MIAVKTMPAYTESQKWLNMLCKTYQAINCHCYSLKKHYTPAHIMAVSQYAFLSGLASFLCSCVTSSKSSITIFETAKRTEDKWKCAFDIQGESKEYIDNDKTDKKFSVWMLNYFPLKLVKVMWPLVRSQHLISQRMCFVWGYIKVGRK